LSFCCYSYLCHALVSVLDPKLLNTDPDPDLLMENQEFQILIWIWTLESGNHLVTDPDHTFELQIDKKRH